MKMRQDLISLPRTIGSRPFWVIKDPIQLEYHHYPDSDYYVLQLLNGRRSAETIQKMYRQRFGVELSEKHFRSLIGSFVQDQLVHAQQATDGRRLHRVDQQNKSALRKSRYTNPLAIRLPGWDLSRCLDLLMPWTSWIVNPLTAILILLAVAGSATLVLANFEEFQRRLPVATEFFGVNNILLLFACLAITKILHELAHALTCRHFGAECHEIGIMFLVFMPCLYCDVSDAWMIASKWRRVAVALAGITVELALAAVCTFLWWWSDPGHLHHLCLNIMFICSVGTVLFNANPLLRYDGYFALSDLLDIPNLWARSRQQVRTVFNSLVWGIDEPSEPANERGYLVFGYGLASMMYRVLLVVIITFFLLSLLTHYQLDTIAIGLLIVTGFSLVAVPIWSQLKFLDKMINTGRVKPKRVIIIVALTSLAMAMLYWLPVPYQVSTPAYIELTDAQRVYVSTPGTLVHRIQPGSQIDQGQVLVQLTNDQLRISHTRLTGQMEQTQKRIEGWESLRGWDPKYGEEIPAAREAVASLQQRLSTLESQIDRLTLVSQRNGSVFHPYRTRQAGETLELPEWSGHPLDEMNVGSYYNTGELLCLIGDPSQFDGFALLKQEVIDVVSTGQNVTMQIAESPSRMIQGTITEISQLNHDEVHADLREFLTDQFESQFETGELQSGRIYLARIHLNDEPFRGMNLERARAKIQVEPRTLFSRASRYVRRTFSSVFD